MKKLFFFSFVFLTSVVPDFGADVPLDKQFEADVERQAAELEYERPIPKTPEEWTKKKALLRADFVRRLGYLPPSPCSLNPVVVKRIDHDDYSIEVIYFRSRPGVYVTGALYLPKTKKGEKVPAVLNLMGHGESPTGISVQLRALALVKEGIACFSVDPFGTTQRSILTQIPPQQELIDYHGGRPGAALTAFGTPLLGLEVYDHMRALDYLQSRPEIDPDRLAAMGVSGGATHTQWILAADPRIKAAAAATSLGAIVTFKDAFIGQHCPCDDVPGGFVWGTMAENKALAAPGAFLQIICTDPGVTDATRKEQSELLRNHVQPYYDLMGVPQKFQIFIDPNPHSYSKPGLEHTVAFFKRWLKNEGDGTPMPLKIDRTAVFNYLTAKNDPLEPASLHGAKPESPDDLLAFPDGKRPADFLTEPSFAYKRGLEIQTKLPPPPRSKKAWQTLRNRWSPVLIKVLAADDNPPAAPTFVESELKPGTPLPLRVIIHSEPGMDLPSIWQTPADDKTVRRTAILVHPEGKDAEALRALRDELIAAGWNTLSVDLRDTGETLWDREISQGTWVGLRDMVAEEDSVWLERSMMGRWMHDIGQAVGYAAQRKETDPQEIVVIGFGDNGLAAMLEAWRDPRISSVATVGSLASFVSKNGFGNPWRKWLADPAGPTRNVSAFVPNLFWKVADWPQLAALMAPRRLLIANPEGGDKQALDADEADRTFDWTRSTYETLGENDHFKVATDMDDGAIIKWLDRGSK